MAGVIDSILQVHHLKWWIELWLAEEPVNNVSFSPSDNAIVDGAVRFDVVTLLVILSDIDTVDERCVVIITDDNEINLRYWSELPEIIKQIVC
jgi:hypothetical protein